MQPSVSVIIPTFNEEKYLPRLLKSLEHQTLRPKEVIVADAFSTDNTRGIARTFGCIVVDGGLPSKARNNGAKAASSPILLFLDADVILPNSFLEETINEMLDRKLKITSCFIKPMSRLKIDFLLHEFVNYYFKMTKKFHPHIPGFCIFVRKSLHKKIKGFDESVKLCEDHDYVKRAKKYASFEYLRSYRIPVSVRRLSKEGRLILSLKYVAIELHLIFIGQIRRNVFSYKFGEFQK